MRRPGHGPTDGAPAGRHGRQRAAVHRLPGLTLLLASTAGVLLAWWALTRLGSYGPLADAWIFAGSMLATWLWLRRSSPAGATDPALEAVG
jgi:nicotinamide riboside transporter PnuC